jgi:NADH dehydrogenase/NADH:ubiquinone oxidoreductase subunit G
VCLGKNTNLEALNLFNLLTRKYSFFKLRQSETQNLKIDLGQDYLLGSKLSGSRLMASDTCLLIGVNPRYEGSKLNLELRSRYLKGNFNIINVGSLFNLTFSNTNITSNTKILKSLIEGNNLFCQEFVNSSNPVLISSTEVFKRKDSFGLIDMLKSLTKHINLFSQFDTSNQLNVLSLTLNDVGFANFNRVEPLKKKDLTHSTGIYFVNDSVSNSNLKKLLNLKLLNFFQHYAHNNRMLITQNNKLDAKLIMKLRKSFNLNNHLHLPNTVLFETSGTYINTKGNINKIIKVITSLGQTKSDWQIIRKILSYSKKMPFMVNYFEDDKIIFNSNTISHFRNYMGFQYYAASNLNNISFELLEKIAECHVNLKKFKPKRKKLFSSQLRF